MKRILFVLLLASAASLFGEAVYYNSGGTLSIVTDSGATTTGDSGIIAIPYQAFHFTGYTAKLKFGAPYNALHGWANTDTATLRLRTSLSDGQVKTLDSVHLAIPCSLFVQLPTYKLENDTALARSKSLYKDIFFHWIINDTLDDTTITIGQPYYYEIILNE